MKKVSINIYNFSELSEQAKKVALSEFQDINTDYDWWNFTYEDAAQIGLKITSFDIMYHPTCSGELTLSANEVAQNIINNHGESCDTYKCAQSFMSEWQPVFIDYMDESSPNYESLETSDKLQDIEDSFLKELLKCYAVMLENEFEYLTSEEAIIETIEANDYKFTEDGKFYTL